MLPPQISYLTLLPHPTMPSQLQLIVAHPLMTFSLSPLSFFDAHAHGLKLESSASYVGEEVSESRGEIEKLVRTPEGRGVGVLRASGGGESWRLSEGGRRLTKKATWTKADYVVVLHSGMPKYVTSIAFNNSFHILQPKRSPHTTCRIPRLLFTVNHPACCMIFRPSRPCLPCPLRTAGRLSSR